MSIEDTVYSLKEKYQKHSYGIKVKGYISDNPDDWIIQSDLILQRKDGKPINIDDYVILSNKDYNNRLEAARLNAKLELLKPNEVCTESYICVGGYSKKEECENLLNYMKTKFVRFLLLQALTSMNITKDKFMFVPCMDFKNKYVDKDLYKIYKLNDSEIEFIEGMVKEWSDKEDT